MIELEHIGNQIREVIRFLSEVDSTSYFEQMRYLNFLLDLIDNKQYKLVFDKLDSAELWGGSGSLLESEYNMSTNQRAELEELLIKLLILIKDTGKMGKRAKSALKFLHHE